MNIFVNTPSYDIEDPQDGDTYYIDNKKSEINLNLGIPDKKTRITLCLLYEYDNMVTIQTSNGTYILDKAVQELVMTYDSYWTSIGDKNIISYIDNVYKQEVQLNLYNLSKMGTNIVITKDRGFTAGKESKHKMSNLIFIGAPNYQSKSASDGTGAVLIYKRSGDRFFSETIITEGYNRINQNYQGTFGKHLKIVDMGEYDLLVVSAPTKIRSNEPIKNILDDIFGYFYVYSYRKNKFGNFYFYRETKIPFPSFQLTTNLVTEGYDEYLPHGTVYQMEPLKNKGFLVYFVSKALYLYDLTDIHNVNIDFNQSFQPQFIKIFDSDVYLSYTTDIRKISYSSDLWTDPSSVVVTNTYGVENFGNLIYPYSDGFVVGSSNDFFDFDMNYQLKKRITFGARILSFDLFEKEDTRKYFFLLDGSENNVYVIDKNYNLLLNDIYKELETDYPRLIRTDDIGETIYLGVPNHTDLENGITNVGMVVNYDLFFERENKNLSSLFPEFEIFNQTLVEEKTLGYEKHFYLQETFQNTLPLVSNRSNNKKNVEQIYPVIDDTGIVLEMNYDVSSGSFLAKYAKYFIYADPKHSANEYSYLLDASNVYLGWSDNQTLSYNNSANQNEIYVYKKNDKINLVLLGIGTASTGNGLGNKRWNVIESEMSSDPSQNYYDISMSLYDSLDVLQFVQFKKFIHNNDLLFLVHSLYNIKIIDYFTKTVYTKTFTRNISNDLFYIDSFKNLFHLYSQTVDNKLTFYLTIYKSGFSYQNIVLDSVKMDILSRPYEIAAQYYNQAFVLLENYSGDGGTIVVRRFDIQQELLEKIEFEEINISNVFNVNKHIVDIEFFNDSIKKIIFVNTSEKKDKIFQKSSQKIYTLPRLLKTKYQSFEKKYVRQLMVKEKNYVNYEQYQIKDEIPNVFYNIHFQKYFKNTIGIYVSYLFLDNKDAFGLDSENSVQLIKQKERSFAKYIFRPPVQHEFKTTFYDKENDIVIVTAKGLTGPTSYIEIFDVSNTSYVIQRNGEATGLSLRKKTFDKEVCYETLDKRKEIYISEMYDTVNQSIKFWTFSKENNYTPTSYTINVILNAGKEACFHRTLNDEFIMDILINNKVVYFQKSGTSFLEKHISLPNDIVIEEPFDINIISESFFILVSPASLTNPKRSYLFVKNQHPSVNEWEYFGEEIYKLNTLHENTFELDRYYFVDVDVSNNHLELLQNVNINIQSPIFYDSENRFYCIQGNTFYKITHPYLSEILKYHTISSDGSTIYTINESRSLEKLIYFNHANQIIPYTTEANLSTYISHFGTNSYTNLVSDISENGYFTMTSDGLRVSKNYIYQPTKSRKFNTTEFPLIDISHSVYMYESPTLYHYKINTNQYVFDSSKNLTNFEMPIDSDETFFTNSKFNTMMYNEIVFKQKKQLLNSTSTKIPVELSISPDASEFLVYQGYTLHLFKQNMLNYPNKYQLVKSMVPSNDFKYEMAPDVVAPIFNVDWINHRIFNSYATVNIFTDSGSTGATGATGPIAPRISIFTWDPNHSEYEFHSDICGNRSFGYVTHLSNDGNRLFVSEPRAPASNGYQEGAIHIYEYNISLNRFVLNKTLRSQKSKIGYIMKVSSSMDRIATFGYRNTIEDLELVIFYDLDSTPKEISIKANPYDMVFLGNTNTLFVEENLFYEDTNKKRTFYLIEQVNECPNILTKVILPNILFQNNFIMFKLTSFGHNYILLDGPDSSNIVQIKEYKMEYIATQMKALNSKVVVTPIGNTSINMKESSGKFIIYGSW